VVQHHHTVKFGDHGLIFMFPVYGSIIVFVCKKDVSKAFICDMSH
jgi:hypothetical protein